MTQDKVSRLSDVEKNDLNDDQPGNKNSKLAYKPSYGERWNKARPTKTMVFGIAVVVIILTIVVGFNWGGWVTGGAAQEMTTDAVAQRLSLICVGQYNQDPQKEQKLNEFQDTSPYQRDNYVKEQGWATMPGEDQPDNKVADSCAKLIAQSAQ
jgi:hypothetical protein